MSLSGGPFQSARGTLNAIGRMAEVQLGKMLQPAASSVQDIEVPYLRAGHLSQVPDELPRMWAAPKDMSQYQVEAGDILVAEGGDMGRVGFVPKSASGALIQNSLHRIRPKGGRDRRFLAYVLEAVYLGDWLDVLCNKSTFGHLTVEKLKALRVPDPSAAKQSAIADYLDTETARIDALITKKQRMIELSQERLAVELDLLLGKATSRIRLKHCVDLLPGYAFASENFSTEALGPRLLRGVNVNPGAINWDETVRLVESVPAPSRYKVEVGDVVIGMDRPFVTSGTRVAVVDADTADSLLVQRVCRIKTSSASAAVLVAEALRSSRFRSYIEVDLSGVSVPHLSDEQIGNFVVPDLVATGDAETSHRILDATQVNRHLVRCLSSQINLLRESRQALITAAVTGELEIPRVAA